MGISDIVGPDTEVEVNDNGGAQSKIPVRFDLIDARALFEQAKVLHQGAEKYGANNWRKIPVDDHLNHLIMHAYAYLSGDRSDEHLSHIMCRATFAQGVAIADAEEEQRRLENQMRDALSKPAVTSDLPEDTSTSRADILGPSHMMTPSAVRRLISNQQVDTAHNQMNKDYTKEEWIVSDPVD